MTWLLCLVIRSAFYTYSWDAGDGKIGKSKREGTYTSVHFGAADITGGGVITGVVAAAQSKDVVAGKVVQAQGWPDVIITYLWESPQSHQPPPLAIAAHVFCGSAAWSQLADLAAIDDAEVLDDVDDGRV